MNELETLKKRTEEELNDLMKKWEYDPQPHLNQDWVKGSIDGAIEQLKKVSEWISDIEAESSENENQKDMVNNPSHYNQTKFSTIREMRLIFGDEDVMTFCKLNAWKYKSRAMFKGKPKEDLKKADWYLDELRRLEEGMI